MNGLFLLTFLGTMALSLWAAAKVKIAYAKGSQVPASSGFTGAEAAARILDAAGIRNVQIVEQDGLLGDHYDPMHRRLVLSTQNFHGHSAAALGVAAHECGHAIQHKIAYAPLQWRMASVRCHHLCQPDRYLAPSIRSLLRLRGLPLPNLPHHYGCRMGHNHALQSRYSSS